MTTKGLLNILLRGILEHLEIEPKKRGKKKFEYLLRTIVDNTVLTPEEEKCLLSIEYKIKCTFLDKT